MEWDNPELFIKKKLYTLSMITTKNKSNKANNKTIVITIRDREKNDCLEILPLYLYLLPMTCS